MLKNTPRWFSPHTLLPAGSTLRPCQVHKNIPNKSAWCKEGNRKTLITSSHICECLFLGPMLNTNTKRACLFLETLKLVLGYSKETLEHLPSACLCDSFNNPDRGGKKSDIICCFCCRYCWGSFPTWARKKIQGSPMLTAPSPRGQNNRHNQRWPAPFYKQHGR